MIKELKLPEIAENVETATVLTLLVSEGDTIEKDQNVAEMESDKATFDLPSEIAGKIKEIKVSEGDDVNVGDVVMTIETEEEGGEEEEEEKGEERKEKGEERKEKGDVEEDEEEEEEEREEKGEEDEDEEDEEKVKAEEKKEEVRKEKQDEGEKKGEERKEKGEEREEKGEEKEDEKISKGKEVPASPSVRRLARELGIDITKVEGTGPADRITSDDVKAFAKEAIQKSDQKEVAAGYELPDFSKWGEIEKKPMDSIRKRTARNMVASWQSIPHVFQFDKADVTELENFRKKYSKEVEKEGGKLTVTAILLKIVAKALQTFPKFNASLDLQNEEVIYKKYINIGVAVDTERGLLVPVIKDVDKKSITELSVELGEIADAARNKKIKPDQLQGGNIAISNLGGIGGTNFTPIIYRPNVAIIGVSRTTVEPVWMDDDFEARQMLPLSLSYDHRLIDGAEAARFLRWLCEALENPLLTMFKGGK